MFGRPYSILKEDQLLDIIRKFQEVLIETVKIRFKQSCHQIQYVGNSDILNLYQAHLR